MMKEKVTASKLDAAGLKSVAVDTRVSFFVMDNTEDEIHILTFIFSTVCQIDGKEDSR